MAAEQLGRPRMKIPPGSGSPQTPVKQHGEQDNDPLDDLLVE